METKPPRAGLFDEGSPRVEAMRSLLNRALMRLTIGAAVAVSLLEGFLSWRAGGVAAGVSSALEWGFACTLLAGVVLIPGGLLIKWLIR